MMDTLMEIWGRIDVNNIAIREWLNGCLIPLNISMMVIIGYTIWRRTRFAHGWTHYPGANSACALWWIFFADLLRSIMAWAILREATVSGSLLATYRTTPAATLIYISGGIIATAATLRCIWCLAPDGGKIYSWIGAFAFTAVAIVLAQCGMFDWVSQWVVERVMVGKP